MSSTVKLNESELLKMGFTRANVAALRLALDAIGNFDPNGTLSDLAVMIAGIPTQQLQSEIARCRADVDAVTMELRAVRLQNDSLRAKNEQLENLLNNLRPVSLQEVLNRLNHLESAALIERQ